MKRTPWHWMMGTAIVLMAAVVQGQTAKPSAYEGVSHPPANDTIQADDDTAAPAPAQPAAVAPAANKATGLSKSTATDTAPALVARPAPAPADPDAEIVTTVPSRPNELPEGTLLKVRLDQQLSTTTTQPGAEFSAHVVEDVTKDGRVVVPNGATVTGRVLSVKEGHHFGSAASIRLRPDEIDLPDGTRYFLHAEVYDINPHSGSKTDSEGDVVSQTHGKRTVAEGALSASAGLTAGAMIAGVPGALIGAAAGAGVVTAHWLFSDHQAVLPKDSEVVFGLTEPMSLVPLRE